MVVCFRDWRMIPWRPAPALRYRRLESFRPQQGVGQVKQQPGGNDGGECVIEDHDRSPSEPVAGVGITYRQHEKAQSEGQHDDVQH